MAEARAEEDDERLREAGGARRSAAEHSDRNKPDQRHSSAGPLSSIRAAIKRTSTRTSSQSDHHRDRRRPEITILSAEPLPSNTWFPGASGAFPPAPPPAPPSWSAASGTVQLPPPTYEQVIKEKTREQILHSTSLSSSSSTSSSSPPSSRRSTSTIATQTDTDSPDQQSTAACSVRKPPKPPRPSLPQTSPHTKPFIDSGRSNQPGDAKPQTRDTPRKPEQRDAQSDFADVASGVTLLDSAPTATTFTQSTLDFSPDPVKEEQSVRPRPRPRSRASLPPIISEEILDQPMTREVKVQTLVRLKDDGPANVFAGFSDNSSNFSSKYLQDLLDVFGSEEASFYDDQQQSEEKNEDETVISAVPFEPINRPQPRPRTQKAKPPLAPKPCILETEETGGSTAKPNLSKQTSSPPVAAPRPLLNQHHSPSDPSRDSLSESASHEHLMEDFSLAETKDSSEVLMKKHPTSPEKTAVNLSDKNIINRPSVPRHTRPPPPLHRSVSFTSQVAGVTVTAASLPSLPPRPSGGRLLPLRPPPIKMTKPTGPSSSSAAANQLSESRVPKRGPPLPPRPKSGHPLYKSYSEEEQLIVLDDTSVLQTQPDPLSDLCSTPEVKGEDVPVCGDVLEDSSADAQIHSRCVARFAFSGEEGELTFSEGDVITLIEYVNEEWGRGCMNGQIGIFPLSFIKEESDALPRKPALASSAAGGRNRGRALHDFSPECEDELCLKAGDVVCDLEDMDAEWFLGEFGGKLGIIPKNYIQVLPEP